MPGSTAAMPYATSRATGSMPLRIGEWRSATIIAAAPLFNPGALPAVIVPSGRNAGLSLRERLERRLRAVVLRPCRSSADLFVPDFHGRRSPPRTRPAACAAAKRCCDRSAQRS